MNSLGKRITDRQLAQHLFRQLQSLRLRSTATVSTVSSGTKAKPEIPEIKIPFRKERGPTDVLSALEKTIKRDPTAAHYKYIDDPFFMPMSNMAKVNYSLAKESGRKAAMWILKEHANLFQHKLADPPIPAFSPKAVYEKKEEVSEELLLNLIKQGCVEDSYTVYKLLEEDTSVECKQALLELLCYYNSQEQIPDDLLEERWYRNMTKQANQWKENPDIRKLFEFLKKQDKEIAAAAYNTMICGTSKYLRADIAWALFEECEEKDIPLNLNAYNSIIQLVPQLRDSAVARQNLLFELLKKISIAGLKPDIGTFNSALKAVSAMSHRKTSMDLVRSLFTDFKKMGIKPSLASYYYALIAFCNDRHDRDPKSTILREVMNELEGKTFTMQDEKDTYFFVKAMELARTHLADFESAEKIHKLLLTGDNYDFIGDNLKENIYYRNYFFILMDNLPLSEFLTYYDNLVPNIYIPEPSVMLKLLETIELAEPSVGREILPRLWSQMIMFNQMYRNELVEKAIDIMRTNCAPPEDSPFNKIFADAAWYYWNHVADRVHIAQRRIQQSPWSGTLLANVALLCLRGDEFDRFLHIIEYMVDESSNKSIAGIPTIEQLNEMFTACMDRGYAPGAINVLRCTVNSGYDEGVTMAKQIKGTIPLSSTEESQLNNIVGTEAVKTKSSIQKSRKKPQ